MPKAAQYQKTAGIYAHIPFCVKKCGYCDFYSITDTSLIPRYMAAVIRELVAAEFPNAPVDTVYIGGGTPSLLTPGHIRRLLSAAGDRFTILPSPEITLEINPGTVTKASLKGFRGAGVNRLNIGVQSFCEASLVFLSRIHTAREAAAAYAMAREAGFDNIGLDLIYGLPGQDPAQWKQDLEQAVALGPEHLSCYMLTYEAGTPLAEDLAHHRFTALSEGALGKLYELTVRYLTDRGYLQYEISNFSRSPETRSRHNQKYWRHDPYLGLGPAAHSYILNRRWWNVRSVERYMEAVSLGKRPVEGMERLNHRQLLMEAVYLGLRCVGGLDIPALEARFGIDFNDRFGQALSPLETAGLVEKTSDRCRLTPRGMLVADSIASRLVERI